MREGWCFDLLSPLESVSFSSLFWSSVISSQLQLLRTISRIGSFYMTNNVSKSRDKSQDSPSFKASEIL